MNGYTYKDEVLGVNLHTIDSKFRKKKYKEDYKLPKSILNQCRNAKFW